MTEGKNRFGLYVLVIFAVLNSCAASNDAEKAVKLLEKMQSGKAAP